LNGRGLYLDPTDGDGLVSDRPSPGTPWPFSVDVSLAYVNEPNAGQAICNVVRIRLRHNMCTHLIIHPVAGSIHWVRGQRVGCMRD